MKNKTMWRRCRSTARAEAVPFCLPLLVVALLILDGLAPASAAPGNPLSALSVRPSNTTCLAGDAPPQGGVVQMVPAFQEVTSRQPFDIKVSPVDSNRYFYITRPGRMASFIRGQTTVVQALDIADRIGINTQANAYTPGGSEHFGLVSFAFHPQFATNPNRRWVFVVYNGRQAGDVATTSYLARFTFPPGNNLVADPASEVVLLRQLQSQPVEPGLPTKEEGHEVAPWLHHFSHVAFGPDGYLYLGSGDGTLNGRANIPYIPAQLLGDLRGKVLRIDVNGTSPSGLPYRIPPDNPWVGTAGARQEIYAVGVRNPWRFNFDSGAAPYRLWLGDVGDSTWEEVNDITRGGNYGWPIFEADQCRQVRPAGQDCTRPQTPPAFKTNHDGRSIASIGGHVYRGTLNPSLQGRFIFSIWGAGEIYAIARTSTGYQSQQLTASAPKINLFFTDAQNELYGVAGAGLIYKMIPGGTGDGTIPQRLSQTGCVNPANPKAPAPGLIPFQVNSPLWSDGAGKRRWLALPNGKGITIRADGDFVFPTGTVLMKSFYAQGKPFETRQLKLHNNGKWAGYSYQWNAAGTDATLVAAAGRTIQIEMAPGRVQSWRLPGRGECMVCHTSAAAFALGPEIAQLNSFMTYPGAGIGHQLATWDYIGLFPNDLPKPVKDLPALSPMNAMNQSNIQRSRSYLHANCSGCHRPGVSTRSTMDLRYNTPVTAMNACNAQPRISDLGVPGALLLDPGNPAASVLSLRMSRRGADQMPPLATSVVDSARLVINAWISRSDVCAPLADTDGDGVTLASDNCSAIANAGQWDSDGDKFGDACDGDLNNDLVTDAADRALLTGALNAELGTPAYKNAYDFNLDGRIDALDVGYFNARLVNRAPGPSGVRPVR